jgi:hypothetical protein
MDPDTSVVTEPPVCCIGVINAPATGSVSAHFWTLFVVEESTPISRVNAEPDVVGLFVIVT